MKKLLIAFLCLLSVFLCACKGKEAKNNSDGSSTQNLGAAMTESKTEQPNNTTSNNASKLMDNYGDIPAKKLSQCEKIYVFDVNNKLSWMGYKGLDYVLEKRADITADSKEITSKSDIKNFVISMDFGNWKETTLPTKSMPKAYIYFENNDLQINMEALFNNKAYASLNTDEKTVYYEIPTAVYNSIIHSSIQATTSQTSTAPEEIIKSSDNSSKAVASKSFQTGKIDKVDFSNKEIINIAPNITSQQVLKIKSGMKYSEVFEILGVGANYCDFKLNVYRVDSKKVLVLRPDSQDVVCEYSGQELLDGCTTYPESNPALKEKQIFGIVIRRC